MHQTIASLIQMLTLGEKLSISESYTITITIVELRKLQSIMKRLGVHSENAVLLCLTLVCLIYCCVFSSGLMHLLFPSLDVVSVSPVSR